MTTITVAQLLPVRHRCCGTPGSTALTSTQLDPPVRRAGPASQAPTAQRLLRSNTKSAQLLPASCRRNLRPLPATIHHIPQPTYPITHVTSGFPESSHLTP
ncbi:hypothetical protein [Corynebacterium matruchotii]|uniref:Uncharacterized protein n=1 Tax=Corynebacterium matruchotii ATCC 33806 TaxID=566549 RepID=C0E1I5_9CORY|nr:hypothetical protein [Corynebacterium matruchotii]EEG27635.1 hypothetical protein CORMATOL_00836 [Corynebacterium matruchotii ATCC 33806]